MDITARGELVFNTKHVAEKQFIRDMGYIASELNAQLLADVYAERQYGKFDPEQVNGTAVQRIYDEACSVQAQAMDVFGGLTSGNYGTTNEPDQGEFDPDNLDLDEAVRRMEIVRSGVPATFPAELAGLAMLVSELKMGYVADSLNAKELNLPELDIDPELLDLRDRLTEACGPLARMIADDIELEFLLDEARTALEVSEKISEHFGFDINNPS